MPVVINRGPFGRVNYGTPAPFGFAGALAPDLYPTQPGRPGRGLPGLFADPSSGPGAYGPASSAPVLMVSDDETPSAPFGRGFFPAIPDPLADQRARGNAGLGRFLKEQFGWFNGGSFFGGRRNDDWAASPKPSPRPNDGAAGSRDESSRHPDHDPGSRGSALVGPNPIYDPVPNESGVSTIAPDERPGDPPGGPDMSPELFKALGLLFAKWRGAIGLRDNDLVRALHYTRGPGRGGGGWGDDQPPRDFGPECEEEWSHFMRLCEAARTDENLRNFYGRDSRDIFDCLKRNLSPQCGGIPPRPPRRRKPKRYDLGPKDPDDE
jgi:hypothetical protein